jgi:hypothetical protein
VLRGCQFVSKPRRAVKLTCVSLDVLPSPRNL